MLFARVTWGLYACLCNRVFMTFISTLTWVCSMMTMMLAVSFVVELALVIYSFKIEFGANARQTRANDDVSACSPRYVVIVKNASIYVDGLVGGYRQCMQWLESYQR